MRIILESLNECLELRKRARSLVILAHWMWWWHCRTEIGRGTCVKAAPAAIVVAMIKDRVFYEMNKDRN